MANLRLISVALLIVNSPEWVGGERAQSQNVAPGSISANRGLRQRHLQGRHSDSAREFNVEIPLTTCIVNRDGTFGSILGESTQINYGFGIETSSQAPIGDVLSSISKTVEEELLATFFPSVCSRTRYITTTGVIGFRFNEELHREAGTCTPTLDSANTCKIYEGTFKAYGNATEVLSKIEYHLSHENVTSIHGNLMRIFSVDSSTNELTGFEKEQDEAVNGTASSGGGMQTAAVAGIVVSMITLLGGVLGLMMFHKRQRSTGSVTSSSRESVSSMHSDILTLRDEHEEFVTIDLQGGSSIVLEGGRPKIINEVNSLL